MKDVSRMKLSPQEEQEDVKLELFNSNKFITYPKKIGLENSYLVSSSDEYNDLTQAYQNLEGNYSKLQIRYDSLQSQLDKILALEPSTGSLASHKFDNQPINFERNKLPSTSNINNSSIGRIRKNVEKLNDSINLSFDNEFPIKYGRKSSEKAVDITNHTYQMSSVLKPKNHIVIEQLQVI